MLNPLITFGLSILVFAGALHIDLHDHSHAEGYSICIPECDNDHHHSFFHQCEKCLNKTSRLIVEGCMDLSYDEHVPLLYSLNEGFNDSRNPYSTYSRPPPSLL